MSMKTLQEYINLSPKEINVSMNLDKLRKKISETGKLMANRKFFYFQPIILISLWSQGKPTYDS